MLKNYFKIAWRHVAKNRIDAAISIGGLALGIACCILLVLYVQFDWSFDGFHEQSDHIFRVVSKKEAPSGKTNLQASAPYQLGPELQKSYPELQQVVRVQGKTIQMEKEGNLVDQPVIFADSSFFTMFSFKLLNGSVSTVLSSPDDIVLTADKARQLFGTTDVIGKTIGLKLADKVTYFQISGIAAKPPAHSSIQFELVVPYQNIINTYPPGILRKIIPKRWDINFGEAYVSLNPKADIKRLEAKFPSFVKAHYGKSAKGTYLQLQPLKNIHLSPEVSSQLTATSSPLYSWILAGIALVVLIIACINFMSLTLSRSSARLNEVGVRKVAGAGRLQLGLQFLGEAVLTCFLSLVLGLILTELAMPYFKQLVDKSISYSLWNDPILWFLLGGMVLVSAVLTGLYPAVAFSRKRPVDSLKGNRVAQQTPAIIKALIVVQFTLSLALISSAFIMHEQMNFISNKDLGFNDKNVVVMTPAASNFSSKNESYKLFRQKVSRLPHVENVASSLANYGHTLQPAELDLGGRKTMAAGLDVIDSHYLQTLGINIIKGRGFSEARPSDLQNGVLVNQTFVQQMGWEHPVGKEMPQPVLKKEGSTKNVFFDNKKVIGVVRDYNYRSLHNVLGPLILVNNKVLEGAFVDIWMKIDGERISETLAALQKAWKSVAPDQSVKFSFLDDVIQQQYKEERRWQSIVDISSVFAIGLACFGLFGLVSLATQKRTKEIGVRKVLGASITSIIGLMSKDFLKLVAIGFVIAVPIAWYAMHKWLADFAYKIDIGPGIFLLAGGLALFIALVTVSWQSVKAAIVNPVDSLRSE